MKKTKDSLKIRLRKKAARIISEIVASDARRKKSRAICAKIFSHPFYKKARSVMFFIPKKDEPDITPLIRRELKKNSLRRKNRRTIYAPRCVASREGRDIMAGVLKDFEKDLIKGAFGILEPKTRCLLSRGHDGLKNFAPDLVIVPARAYDVKCRRLGRGGGYYDRFLKKLPEVSKTMGVVFDECIFKDIPSDKNDVSVDVVITDRRMFHDCSS